MWGFYNSYSKFEEFMKQKEQKERLIAETIQDLRIKEHSYLSVSEIILEDFKTQFPGLSPSTATGKYLCDWAFDILLRNILWGNK